MNKAQVAALLLAGATAGAGGSAALSAALGKADAATTVTFAHAVDLRRDYSADAGSSVRVAVWATQTLPDGGTKDIGPAASCKLSKTTADGTRALMNVLGKECNW